MKEDYIELDALIARWGGGNKGTLALIDALESGKLSPRDGNTGMKVSPEAVAALVYKLRQRMELSQ